MNDEKVIHTLIKIVLVSMICFFTVMKIEEAVQTVLPGRPEIKEGPACAEHCPILERYADARIIFLSSIG